MAKSNKDYVLALYHQQTVEELFDDYAESFDDHLQKGLRYNVPNLLHEFWTKHVVQQQHDIDGSKEQIVMGETSVPDQLSTLKQSNNNAKMVRKCLDLGCGTGLAGAVFRNDCVCLEGVDLSQNMCRLAKCKHIYDKVAWGSLLSHLKQQDDASFDLVLAADVFMYVLDLDVVLEQVERILMPNGWCVFSTECLEDDHAAESLCRRESERFAHKRQYILDMASALRFKILSVTRVVLRMEEENPVLGDIFVFRKGP